jgi:tetratricopeptide (TPR) repeat protein
MRFWWKAAAGLVLALGPASGAQAAWWQAQTRHFTVHGEGNDDRLRGLAERLEKFDFLLRTLYGVKSPDADSPVMVYVLSSEQKVKDLARNRNVAGFYTTSDRKAFAVLSRSAKTNKFDLGPEEVLFHEYAHHFMLHHFPAAYPAWYVEGFAEFFSVVKFKQDGAIEFGHAPMARVPGLVIGSPYPVKNLFARNADGLSLRDGDRYYGTAWLLTHYYQYDKSGRRPEISRYLNDLANGVPDMQPDSYFAGGLDGLEKDLKAYMRHRLSASSLKPSEMTIGAITVSPVDPAQGALLEDELRLLNRPSTEQVPGIVTAIRATAAKYPQSAYALALLAEAEWKAEEKDAALADADRAIALDPNSARAYAVRARVLLERAHDSDKAEEWKAALTAIVRANRADTEDPVPLALFYRYHAMRGGKMPDIGYDGLYKAFTLLPQNPDYRFNFAHAMAARGDYAQASMLLDPIAYSPHGSDMRDAALRMKAGLDAQAAEKKAGNPPPAS